MVSRIPPRRESWLVSAVHWNHVWGVAVLRKDPSPERGAFKGIRVTDVRRLRSFLLRCRFRGGGDLCGFSGRRGIRCCCFRGRCIPGFCLSLGGCPCCITRGSVLLRRRRGTAGTKDRQQDHGRDQRNQPLPDACMTLLFHLNLPVISFYFSFCWQL